MSRITIPVQLVEFEDGGNTIWIQSEVGTTVRIKCTGKIKTETCEVSPISHLDLIVEGDINFCLSKDAQEL
jgi:hypothetical protein